MRAGEGWLAGAPGARPDHPPLPGRRRALARTALARLAELGDEPTSSWSRRSTRTRRRPRPRPTRRRDAEPEAEASASATVQLAERRIQAVVEPCCETRGAGATACSTSAAAQGELLGALLARTRRSPGSSASTSRPRRCTIAARRLELDRMPRRQAGQRVDAVPGRAHLRRRAAGRLRRGGAHGGRRARRPAAAAGARTRRVRRTPGPASCSSPPRTSSTTCATRASTGLRHPDHRFEWTRAEFAGLGRAGRAEPYGYQVELPCRSATTTPRSGRPPRWRCSPDELRVNSDQRPGAGRCVVLVGVSGSRQVDVRAPRTSARPGRLLRLLPRPGRRRRERPVRHHGRVRRAALHRRHAAAPAACSPSSTPPTSSRRPRSADRAGQGARRAGRSRSCWTCPRRCAIERNAAPADRDFGPTSSRASARDLRRSLRPSARGGLPQGARAARRRGDRRARIVRTRSRGTTGGDLTGPFDIIGDMHGCRAELETLLDRARLAVERDERPAVDAAHPEGRTAVFVGDLVDRGPDTPGVLRLVMGMVAAGTALCVPGNHEPSWCARSTGRKVRSRTASRRRSTSSPPSRRSSASGRADVHGRPGQPLRARRRPAGRRPRRAQGGLPRPRVGPGPRFALYGDTTGETDEYGLPVRYPWASDYRGRAMVVYGHTPDPRAEWVNNTICLDTGCVFGGTLTALRYPEKELVAVPAEQVWYEPVRAARRGVARPAGRRRVLDIGDVIGRRAHRDPAHRPGHGPRGERGRRAGGDEPVRGRPALAGLPAADHGARVATSRARRATWSTRRGVRAYARPGVTRSCARRSTWARGPSWWSAATPRSPPRRFGVGRRDRAPSTPAPAGRSSTTRPDRGSCSTGSARPSPRPALGRARHRLAAARLRAAALVGQGRASCCASSTPRSARRPARRCPRPSRAGARPPGAGSTSAELLDRTRTPRGQRRGVHATPTAAYCWPIDGLDGVRLAPFQVLAAEGRATADASRTPGIWRSLDRLVAADAGAVHADPAARRRHRRRRSRSRPASTGGWS